MSSEEGSVEPVSTKKQSSVSVTPEASNGSDGEDYDPEAGFSSTYELPATSNSSTTTDAPTNNRETDLVDDDYNPETSVEAVYEPPSDIKSPSISSNNPAGLPPKPAVKPPTTKTNSQRSSYIPTKAPQVVPDPSDALRQAYDEIVEAELTKNPDFSNLSDIEQMKVIMPQLGQKNIKLATGTSYSDITTINYDQVYSYNKRFKNLRLPIPLIPVNEFCRRPDITAPMTAEEEAAYDKFIHIESEYMRTQNWDEFPDKSRLFIGNLPANTISKQDLFRIFSQYGEVVQISIKAGYGFTQFRTAEACFDCIKGELNVPLHNKIMRLDASRPQKSKRSADNIRGGRERDGTETKRQRRNAPDCQIYTTGKSSVFFVRKVKRCIQDAHLTSEIEDVTHREISEVIGESAYSGVLGTCVVKQDKCDVQTFETTPDGGIKFDEYSDIGPEVAAEILQKAKEKSYRSIPQYQGGQYDQYHSQDTYYGTGGSQEQTPAESGPNYGGGRGNYGDRRMGRDRMGRRGGRGGRNTDTYTPGGRNNFGRMYGTQDPNMYGAQDPTAYGSAPQPYTNQPGYGQQNYGNGQQNYGNAYGSYNPNAQGNPQTAYSSSPQLGGNDQSGLIQALQTMDPASMQNMISLLQQQQQQQQQQQPPHSSTQQMGVPVNNKRGYGQNQPIDYGSGTPQSSVGPSSQVSSLLSQLQSQNNHQQQQSQQPNNSKESSSTQSIMDTLARLSRK